MATDEPNEPAPRRGPYLKRPRGERNPPGKFSYPVQAKNQSVEKQWEALCASHAGNARRCYDHLATTPYDPPPNPDRGHALRGSKRLGRRELLQYEVGGVLLDVVVLRVGGGDHGAPALMGAAVVAVLVVGSACVAAIGIAQRR